MTRTLPQHRTPGEIVVLSRADDIAGGALIRGLVPDHGPGPDVGALANVVPFRRPKAQGDAPPCVVDPAARPTPPAPAARSFRFSLAIAATVLMHGAAFAAFFLYQPPPLASIGVEAISVEIVVGSNSLAGDTDPNSRSEANSKYAPPEEKLADQPTTDAAQKAPQKNRELAATEPAPPQPVEEPKAEAAPAQTRPEPPQEKTVLVSPEALVATPEPPKVQETRPAETKPIETKPAETKRETPKPVVKKPEPKPRREAATKKPADAPKTQVAAAPAPSVDQTAARGAGIGRSNAASNFKGRVYAHLMRFKPLVGSQSAGSVTVHFTLNGNGTVISGPRVSSTSGNASLDEAALAMVRRASPFPQPGPGDDPWIVFPLRLDR